MEPDYTKIYAALTGNSIEDKYEAVSELHKHFHESLSKQLRRQFNALNEWQAEEIVGDAFLRILDNIKNSKPLNPHDQYSIVGWLRQFVFFTAKNLSKSKKYLPTTSLTDEKLTEEEMIEYLTDIENKSPIPLVLDCFGKAVKDFGRKYPEQCEIISDRVIRGIGYEKLAIKYGKELNNIKRICSKFGNLLEEKMEPCLD